MNVWKCPWMMSNMTMCAIIDKISQSEFCLNDLFVEGDKHGVGQVMKDLWEMDKRKIKEEFMRDQKKNSEYACKQFIHVHNYVQQV